MKWIFGLLALLVLAGSCRAEGWWRVFGPVRVGAFGGGHVDREAVLTDAQRAFLKKPGFKEWEVYEDDLVRLEYPKDPALKFRVADEGGPVEVEGGVCTTVDNSFQRAYVLEVGEITYGVFLVNAAEWLDDGICLCGPMVHHVYNIEDGCLVRFSLLPGGAVKKAQVLGDKLRLMAFEWTHLGCPRPVYERMVEKMALKVPHRTDADGLKAKVNERYGIEGRGGWLHPGMTVEDVKGIMGAPTKGGEDVRSWTEPYRDYLTTLTVTFDNGRLVKLEDEGLNAAENPIAGTLSWVEEEVRALARERDPEGVFGEPEERKPVDVPKLLAAMKKLGDEIEEERWWEFGYAVHGLVQEAGIRNRELLALVRKRDGYDLVDFRVLRAYEIEDLAGWTERALRRIMKEGPGGRGTVEEMLEWLLDNDEKSGAVLAGEFLASGEGRWFEELIALATSPPPELHQALVVGSLEHAIEARDSYWVTETLDFIRGADGAERARLSDPAVVLEKVRTLPEGKPETDWETARRDALQLLEALVKSGKPRT